MRLPLNAIRQFSTKTYLSEAQMANTMTVTLLGTSSGGGPSLSRNCSSLVVDALGDGSLWMVDCAEGTLRQFSRQPFSADNPHLRVSRINKMFVTHMHADHVMGIIPMLRNVLLPSPTGEAALQFQPDPLPKIEIYGPAGIRTFVRSILKMTLTRTRNKYVVHELLTDDDKKTPCDPPEIMHVNEVAGRDIVCSEDGFWHSISKERCRRAEVAVDAGPIAHRDPCLGFVFRECSSPNRKIVVLGDTNDPSAIIPLCTNPSPSLLVHEATEAHIPRDIDPKSKRSFETVMEKATARGHSLPQMAGAFAKTIGAQKLVLNHIGGRFPAPGPNDRNPIRGNVIAEIERQASEAWGMGTARAAWDFMRVAIPVPTEEVVDETESSAQAHSPSNSYEANFPTVYNTTAADTQPNNEPKLRGTFRGRGRGGRRGFHHHVSAQGHVNNTSTESGHGQQQQHSQREGVQHVDRSERRGTNGPNRTRARK
ncbi:hypothetical protein K435DRAFT_777033 [Dendrothele bispora CBS 962.96]|uniref:Uncharacterized protein n=1 Tax=Dendrothele bispora (strain CBS 962.96) TaxID=1314807 RepID=A0A4V4HGM0_DENBC|nr:hypothetical protein K435DRAFT_777033 [Dendrothele bispora CBS 962.96]